LQIEKWITFLILAFILLIATCNIIGSLSMLMINKRGDIALFDALGAPTTQVRRLFLFEGWMIAIYGAVVGVILGVIICAVQQHFGIISMGSGYVVEQYPVEVRWSDVLAIFGTVVALGFVLAAYPASVIKK
jgi:lipoprotein-releasing system permease protein